MKFVLPEHHSDRKPARIFVYAFRIIFLVMYRYLADFREDRFGGVQEIYSCIFEFFRLLLGELELNQECNATPS
ncbi:hypothetical protein MKW98_000572 [Papaver atlanticum]|uniref:Uncharacterized protein n=1 Tax=Papaver atlanticum TaxID=357466 RepID=A0AAD4S608_9MAGN|nr:hypothetical protein MKW98_000572 [Papaver atlanticum]